MGVESFKSLLTRIASAIRKQTGSTELIPADELDFAVESLAGNNKELFGMIDGSITELNLKYSGIKEIGSYSLYSKNNLTTLILPDGLETIKEYAMQGCIKLTELEIPDGTKNMQSYALKYCSGLKKVIIPTSLTWKNWETSATFDLYYKGTLDDWFNVSISGNAYHPFSKEGNIYFLNNGEFELLENLIIPENITEIKKCLFYRCKSIKNIIFNNNIKTIQNHAFQYCSGLTEINIPDSVETIMDSAFANCNNTLIANLGSGIKSIGYESFYSLNSKCVVIMNATIPPALGSSNFKSVEKIFVPAGTRNAYISATNWSSLADKIFEPNTITLSIPTTLLNNANYTYSIDNGETWNQFSNTSIAVENINVVRFKNMDAGTTILIGTTSGGSDIGTIANAELMHPTSADETIYLTIQA